MITPREDDYPELGVSFISDSTIFGQGGPLSGHRVRVGVSWAPDFDDSAWQQGQVYPRNTMGVYAEGPRATVVWLRTQREVRALGGPMALTLGWTQGAYEVYVDGVRVGGAGSIERGEEGANLPTAFDIPSHLLDDGLLRRALDEITGNAGSFRIEALDLAERKDQRSRADLRVTAPDAVGMSRPEKKPASRRTAISSACPG